MRQRPIHAYDANGKYQGIHTATDEQLAETSLVEGEAPAPTVNNSTDPRDHPMSAEQWVEYLAAHNYGDAIAAYISGLTSEAAKKAELGRQVMADSPGIFQFRLFFSLINNPDLQGRFPVELPSMEVAELQWMNFIRNWVSFPIEPPVGPGDPPDDLPAGQLGDPAMLFANGEQGVWFDPSDMSTMFQDAGGLTPVTAAGDIVGFIRDKSGNNNHATQPIPAKRRILGRHPASGVRNLLDDSEDFTKDTWFKRGVFESSNQLIEQSSSDANAQHLVWHANNFFPDLPHSFSVEVKRGVGERHVQIGVVGQGNNVSWATFDLDTFTVGNFGGTHVGTPTITPTTDGYHLCTIGLGFPIGGNNEGIVMYISNNALAEIDPRYRGDGVSSIKFRKAQLEEGPTSTPYQKRVSEFDITEDGQTDLWFLRSDGIDDFMETDGIDFTGTDKMSVFTAVRKLSNKSVAMLVELSGRISGVTGAFHLLHDNGDDVFRNKGTSESEARNSSPLAPITQILIGLGDVSDVNSILRQNGVRVPSINKYGNHRLFIGAREGIVFFFKGNDYGLIVRGASSSVAEIANVEAYLAEKAGMTL